jgi:UPF0716 protein FxsA
MTALVLLSLFVGLPILEILTFIEVGGRVGGLTTILATILTAIMGAALFRFQGMTTLARAQASLQNGHMPLEEVIGGLGLLLAAICLFVPGFVTDAVGFLLFIPPIRLVILGIALRPLLERARVQMSPHGFGATTRVDPNAGSAETIDGDYSDISESDPDRPGLGHDSDDRNIEKDDGKV